MTTSKYVAGRARTEQPSDGGVRRVFARMVHAVRRDEPTDDDGASAAMCLLPVYRSEPSTWPPAPGPEVEVCEDCADKAT